jgi:16S rRNA (guanine527-N7)-methyltransferase
MVTRETSISEGLSRLGISASDQDIRRLAQLADLLENDAVELGYLGPNEGRRVISRHILESAALVPFLPSKGVIVDIGSGAGLPGLVLATLGYETILIDAQEKRASFVRRVASEIGVETDVRAVRAEDEARGPLRDFAAAAVARALAAPTVTLELCLPFVRPGGRLAVLASRDLPTDEPTDVEAAASGHAEDVESPGSTGTRGLGAGAPRRGSSGSAPDDATHETHDPARAASGERLDDVARQLGGGNVRWQRLPVPGADAPRWVMMIDKRSPTPERFPRRPGVPKRRPLGGDVASVD